jgi:hypothetical protein
MRRAATLTVAAAGVLVSAALLVREAVLAAGDSVVWTRPPWWHDLVTGPAWLAAPAGALLAVMGAACLWLGLGMLGGAEPDEGAGVELGSLDASVVVKAGALERLIANVLTAELAEVRSARVRVARREERVATRTSLALTPTDLRQLHSRARAVIGRELRAATGLEAEDLVIEVDDLVVGRGGDT